MVPCNDPLKYASLRAEPDFSVLGKKLGKSMGVVAKEVKAMSQADILLFEQSGKATFSGHCLKQHYIKVPLQSDGVQCGYFILRYMRDIIEGAASIDKSSLQSIFAKSMIAAKKIDEVHSEWTECIQDHIYDD